MSLLHGQKCAHSCQEPVENTEGQTETTVKSTVEDQCGAFFQQYRQSAGPGDVDPEHFLEHICDSPEVLAYIYANLEGSPSRVIKSIKNISNGGFAIYILHQHLYRHDYARAIDFIIRELGPSVRWGVVVPKWHRKKVTQGAAFDLWKHWWPRQDYIPPPVTSNHPVVRDAQPCPSISTPETCEVMEGHPFIPGVSRILIRDEYKTAYDAVQAVQEEFNERSPSRIIIGGYPGIGKRTFMYYLLIMRLSAGKVTAFQNDPEYVYFFSKHGVERLLSDSDGEPPPYVSTGDWVIVDPSVWVCPIFLNLKDWGPQLPQLSIVTAASFRKRKSDSWMWKRGGIVRFVMKPWSIEELVMGRQLQEGNPPSEIQLFDFYNRFGPSTRDVYSHSLDPTLYDQGLHQMVENMTWDGLIALLRGAVAFNGSEGYHRIALVQPWPDARWKLDVSFASRTVLELLWPLHFKHQEDHIRELFNNFSNLDIWHSPSGARLLLEYAVHDMFELGGEWPTFPMFVSDMLYCKKQTVYTLPITEVGETLRLRGLKRLRCDCDDSSIKLNSQTYYQPTATKNPSFNSFVYDPDKNQITIFQVLTADEHTVHACGIERIEKILENNGITHWQIKYLVIIERDQKALTVRVPLSLVGRMELCVARVVLSRNS